MEFQGPPGTLPQLHLLAKPPQSKKKKGEGWHSQCLQTRETLKIASKDVFLSRGVRKCLEKLVDLFMKTQAYAESVLASSYLSRGLNKQHRQFVLRHMICGTCVCV